jgi:hypothetical protein
MLIGISPRDPQKETEHDDAGKAHLCGVLAGCFVIASGARAYLAGVDYTATDQYQTPAAYLRQLKKDKSE